MQTAKADHTAVAPNSTGRFIFIAIILVIMLTVGLYINNISRAFQAAPLSPGMVVISRSELEEKYGLRVNLLAVTAAGGMVDLRLNILDGEKAKLLLQDQKNFPALLVNDTNVTLRASEDAQSQEIKFDKAGGLFLLFPNSGNAVTPGSKVSIVFGNIQLEPVAAR